MRKVMVFMMTSLDGYISDRDGGIDWHVVDEKFNEFAVRQLDAMDTIIFGRVTYEGMASYWPTDIAVKNDPEVAERMNAKPKIVFSRTLNKADWNNTRLIKDNIPAEIAKLKQQPGKDLIIFGSSNLSASFINLGLIDELRIMVSPVVLGNGIPLFGGVDQPLKLSLLKTEAFSSGNVLHYYEPIRQ
jgi:dihydrofolate reductase